MGNVRTQPPEEGLADGDRGGRPLVWRVILVGVHARRRSHSGSRSRSGWACAAGARLTRGRGRGRARGGGRWVPAGLLGAVVARRVVVALRLLVGTPRAARVVARAAYFGLEALDARPLGPRSLCRAVRIRGRRHVGRSRRRRARKASSVGHGSRGTGRGARTARRPRPSARLLARSSALPPTSAPSLRQFLQRALVHQLCESSTAYAVLDHLPADRYLSFSRAAALDVDPARARRRRPPSAGKQVNDLGTLTSDSQRPLSYTQSARPLGPARQHASQSASHSPAGGGTAPYRPWPPWGGAGGSSAGGGGGGGAAEEGGGGGGASDGGAGAGWLGG